MFAYHILPDLIIMTFSEECRIPNLAFSYFPILLPLLIFGTLFSNTSKSLHLYKRVTDHVPVTCRATKIFKHYSRIKIKGNSGHAQRYYVWNSQ